MKTQHLTLALAAALLTACGGGSDEPSGPDTSAEKAQALMATQVDLKASIAKTPAGLERTNMVTQYNLNAPMLSSYGADLACADVKAKNYTPAFEDCRTLWRSLVAPI